MASTLEQSGQFDDAPEDIRGSVAYIDTAEPDISSLQEVNLEWPSSEEDEDEDDVYEDEEYFDEGRVEDEDWEIAERGE